MSENKFEGLKPTGRVCEKDGHASAVLEIRIGRPDCSAAVTCAACLWNSYDELRKREWRLPDKCGDLQHKLSEALTRVGELELELRRRDRSK